MKLCLLLLCLSAFIINDGPTQLPPACNCDYTISKGGLYSNATLKVPPGKTVCIQAGHYDYLRFNGFVGTPDQPIRFMNCGGQVTLGVNAYFSGLQFNGSRYFVVSGSGDDSYPYGIKLDQSYQGASGLSIGSLSSDCEVERVEVATAGFAGFMIKTDPSCDASTWRENFTMYNVKLHDNYIHDTGGEGLYIGNSFYNGYTVTCNGTAKTVYPHLIYGLKVYNNIVERTGAEGLQYGCAPDADVHHNQLQYGGFSPFANYQNNGLQISSGSGGDCYSNIIRHTSGTGLIILGHLGNNRIYNNVVYDSGQDGIFCDDRPGSLPDTFVAFLNNTIVKTGRDGIRLYNQNNVNTVANNVITQMNTTPSLNGKAIVFQQGATASMAANFTAVSSASAGFVNDETDFRPVAGSPLINTGVNVASWNVTTDLPGTTREANPGYDIGAYEFIANATSSRPVQAQARAGYTSDEQLHATETYRAPATEMATIGLPSPLTIYPSPAQDQVTIALAQNLYIQKVWVYNATGQKILYQRAPGHRSNSVTLRIGQLPPGNYIIDVLSESAKTFNGRFVKQ